VGYKVVQLFLWSQSSSGRLLSGDLFKVARAATLAAKKLMKVESSLFKDPRCRRSCRGDHSVCAPIRPERVSILQLDFGNLDSDIVTRPLIIKISEHSHRNDKRRDNCNCDWFHDGILRFEIFSTASLIPAMRDPVTRSRPQHRGRWSQSSGSRRLSGGLFKIAPGATLAIYIQKGKVSPSFRSKAQFLERTNSSGKDV